MSLRSAISAASTLGRERVPDATTLLNFRHLLEANRAYAMLALINVSKWNRPLTGEVSAA